MTTFENLGLAEPILKAISAEGYTTPTPIQTKVIPALIKGLDIIGIAQTGTGKTASFVLPLLHQFVLQKRKKTPGTCQVLILSPTRELAAQIVDNIKSYSRFTHLSTALIVGGVRPSGQIKMLNAGVDIIVATPGRLLDHINNGALSLAKTQNLVVDEADQMLSLGFLPDIRKIVARLPVQRQTALLSATMPTQIRKLANDLLTDPEEIKVAAVSKPIERIHQSVRHVEKTEKRQILTEILSDKTVDRAIVFMRTKRGADRICKQLVAADLQASVIHGNKSQNQRDRAIAAFRSGETAILVATDIAARGIDIDNISHVINYELPNVPEAYVHRIGRTARAGRSGTAISLVDPSEQNLLKDIEKLIGNHLNCDTRVSNATTKTRKTEQKSGKSGNKLTRSTSRHKQARKSNASRNSNVRQTNPGQKPKSVLSRRTSSASTNAA